MKLLIKDEKGNLRLYQDPALIIRMDINHNGTSTLRARLPNKWEDVIHTGPTEDCERAMDGLVKGFEVMLSPGGCKVTNQKHHDAILLQQKNRIEDIMGRT